MSATGWYRIEDLEADGTCRWFSSTTQARGVVTEVMHRVADKGARRIVITRYTAGGVSYIAARHDGLTWRDVRSGRLYDVLAERGEIG